MRHRKKFNHLSRKSAHRGAMLRNMAISLIEHKRIKTTVAKAKALRVFVEPVINRSKTDSTHSRRMVFRTLQSKDAVNTLFREVSKKIGTRQGGYTRILKTGNRLGDNADMCFIELVDYNEDYYNEKSVPKKKRTRRGGGSNTEETTSEKKIEKTEEPEAETEVKTEVKTEEATDTVEETKDSKETDTDKEKKED